jgi:crotonobetainyl-CoA:carnitine CoA-transferase CaiB-like acyl-CoA transferase
MANMIDSDQYDDPNFFIDHLRMCNIDSIKIVTFDMSELTPEQRKNVVELRDSIDYENAEKMKAAEKEAERQRAAKKAERLAKKANAKAAAMPTPEEVKAKPVKSEVMMILEEAVVATATEVPSLLAPVTTVDVTTESAKAAAPVIDEDEELAAMLADLENLPS